MYATRRSAVQRNAAKQRNRLNYIYVPWLCHKREREGGGGREREREVREGGERGRRERKKEREREKERWQEEKKSKKNSKKQNKKTKNPPICMYILST